MKIKVLNGSGSLIRSTVIKLIQLFPVYFLVFVAYGDNFLPSPVDYWSYKIRTTINNLLMGSVENVLEENFENSKFNENRVEKISNEVEKQNK